MRQCAPAEGTAAMLFLAAGFVLLLSTGGAVVGLRALQTLAPRRLDVIAATVLATFATLYTLYALELVFRQLAISDGFVETLSGRMWVEKHFRNNSLGYRDAEPEDPARTGRRLALVVGDSFVAGYGIDDPRDRFANLLGERLGERWQVNVAARGGYSTAHEISALQRYPFTPRLVVLSYFVNDIDGAARALGRMPDIRPSPPPSLLRPVVERSHLFNFVYWRFVRSGSDMGRRYWKFLEQAYDDPEIWATEQQQLGAFVDQTRARGIGLLVVLFPHLVQMDASAKFTEKVRDHLASLGVPVLDLYPHLRGRSAGDLVVNSLDSHPNEQVHRETALLLYQALSEARLLADQPGD